MASIDIYTECPHCGKVTSADWHYRLDHLYLYCRFCGVDYSREYVYDQMKKKACFEETKRRGYGVCYIRKNDFLSNSFYFLDEPLTEEKLKVYTHLYNEKDTNKEKSYLITYLDGEFHLLLGSYPEDFFLSLKEYREKNKDIDNYD